MPIKIDAVRFVADGSQHWRVLRIVEGPLVSAASALVEDLESQGTIRVAGAIHDLEAGMVEFFG